MAADAAVDAAAQRPGPCGDRPRGRGGRCSPRRSPAGCGSTPPTTPRSSPITDMVRDTMPNCAALAVTGDADRFSYLLPGNTVGMFATGEGAQAHGVHLFVLSDKDVASGYGDATVELTDWVRAHGTLIAHHATFTYDGLEVWRTPIDPYAPLADTEQIPGGSFVITDTNRCGGFPSSSTSSPPGWPRSAASRSSAPRSREAGRRRPAPARADLHRRGAHRDGDGPRRALAGGRPARRAAPTPPTGPPTSRRSPRVPIPHPADRPGHLRRLPARRRRRSGSRPARRAARAADRHARRARSGRRSRVACWSTAGASDRVRLAADRPARAGRRPRHPVRRRREPGRRAAAATDCERTLPTTVRPFVTALLAGLALYLALPCWPSKFGPAAAPQPPLGGQAMSAPALGPTAPPAERAASLVRARHRRSGCWSVALARAGIGRAASRLGTALPPLPAVAAVGPACSAPPRPRRPTSCCCATPLGSAGSSRSARRRGGAGRRPALGMTCCASTSPPGAAPDRGQQVERPARVRRRDPRPGRAARRFRRRPVLVTAAVLQLAHRRCRSRACSPISAATRPQPSPPPSSGPCKDIAAAARRPGRPANPYATLQARHDRDAPARPCPAPPPRRSSARPPARRGGRSWTPDPDAVATQAPEWMDCLARRGYTDAQQALPPARRAAAWCSRSPPAASGRAPVSEQAWPYGWGYGGALVEGGALTPADLQRSSSTTSRGAPPCSAPSSRCRCAGPSGRRRRPRRARGCPTPPR